MWDPPWFNRLLGLKGIFKVVFQSCMHGGKRPKWSTWVTNVTELKDLSVQCDGSHAHEPWSMERDGRMWTFATEGEAEYPELLCNRAA